MTIAIVGIVIYLIMGMLASLLLTIAGIESKPRFPDRAPGLPDAGLGLFELLLPIVLWPLDVIGALARHAETEEKDSTVEPFVGGDPRPKVRNAQPGATDNPDDAQRKRQDH